MAETIVHFVLGKLGDTVFQEIVFLCGVGNKAELVKRHLNRIQCFLRDADRKCDGDEGVRNWVNELRSVSFWIEDTIDTFLLEIDSLRSEDPDVLDKIKRKDKGIKERIMRVIKKPKKVIAIHHFGVELDKILARIEEITKSRETYGIKDVGESSESVVSLPAKRHIHPELDKTDLVGFTADKEKIIGQLLDETILRRFVVSVVGTGGIGKTTVAQKAYSSDTVKSRFDVRVWLSISQEFKLIDLLKKMLQSIRSIEDHEENVGEEYFMLELHKSLWDKKYLVVMDDVWSDDLWSQIKDALPDVSNGSRVLITSRFANIAKAADPTSEPYELPFLNNEESLQLLLKTALPNGDAKDCPTYLLDIAKQLAEICDGLPLALVVLGGGLSVKSPTRNVWEKVLETMVWSVEGKKCMDILSTSYNDMPGALKSCFMYFACFPEDYEINAQNLIRLWVAEGFIPQQSRKTLEDTAENYLEELAQRYMVIVVRRRYDNSIKIIRLHDLLHDVAISRAKEDNLITVFSKKDVSRSSSTMPRRVTLQFSGGHLLEEHTGPNLRSLHWFSNQVPDCSRHKLLKVCSMEDQQLFFFYNEIGLQRSTQLRFLRVASKKTLWINLNPSIGRLKNLQTLDLRWITLPEFYLPECIWGIKTLRHVLLLKYDAFGMGTISISRTDGPPSGANLENLQTLKHVRDSVSWKTQLPHLTNVRCLKLSVTSPKETIASLLRTLENLISLYLDFIYPLHIDIVDMRTFPFYQHLQKLDLFAEWPDSLDLQTVMLPPHLMKLRLSCSRLKKDPMLELGKLQSLKILILDDAYSGQKMICSAGGFPCLQQLELSRLNNLEQFEREEGAMPTLKQINIKGCRKLRSIPNQVNPVSKREWLMHQERLEIGSK